MNIYEKMAAITAELQTVAKNLNVKSGNGTYKAVSERDILDAVKPLENQYGIYSYPSDREILESAVLETESGYGERKSRKSTFFTRIKTTYTFVNTEKPEERISTIVFSEGIDTQDKGSGKAMTYADKYALMKAYKISTGDDPDQNGSTTQSYTKPGDRPAAPVAPARRQDPAPIKCDRCGDDITSVLLKTGKWALPQQLANFSLKRYGKAYCAKCQKQIEEAQDVADDIPGGTP